MHLDPLVPNSLLNLLQLASPVLPVGAYGYSEGLETLVDIGVIHNQTTLHQWLEHQLCYGAIRLEAYVMVRAYESYGKGDLDGLNYWNAWVSAAKETSELRSQSWQMGNSLMRLLLDLHPPSETIRLLSEEGTADLGTGNSGQEFTQTGSENYFGQRSSQQNVISLQDVASAVGQPCNYAIAFGIGAANWQIDITATVLGYLHSWASNVIGAGVKLIPLGQTVGQQLLLGLNHRLTLSTQDVLTLTDEKLSSCGWGLALASMAHETQYTRLFRS
ncbi:MULTISPECIES: urease accessory protein UreF [unclassified Moorena]|uniref:urease accessory protein UreF n=1 Tax=unclassified Moorena TaxID=2683338 RepID=UPI0014012678|nr:MULTISPECIES: urease accessory protein UreF [unclassified Moorena]NEO15997.1 urease accessory protein UreF [Moorena sp. SIO3E8]NEQ02501.1 urease accessory protein UreF [Moorena sp. SIO3F7]